MNIIFRCILWLSVSLCMAHVQAEEAVPSAGLSLSGYAEAYAVRDFNDPQQHRRPFFTYSHDRANVPSINLALLKASLNTPRLRGNLAVASGTYMRANYAAEPAGLQNVFEANVGIRLSSTQDWWLDAGVMPSHLGFESAIGADNWTMTRSLMAENSPYFETGAKLTYTTPDGQWAASALLLNGWQRIRQAEGNTTPSIGHQLIYKPTPRILLNSSSFIGNDKPDRARQMRYFHDFYAQFQLDDHWQLTTALDIGAQAHAPGAGAGYDVWWTSAVIARYRYSEQWSLAARWEYFDDRQGVIIATETPHGFRTMGYSVNADYTYSPNLMLRAEVRQLDSRDALFDVDGERLRASNLMAATALIVRF